MIIPPFLKYGAPFGPTRKNSFRKKIYASEKFISIRKKIFIGKKLFSSILLSIER